jgi:uncharacterized protein (TIGR03086 family)
MHQTNPSTTTARRVAELVQLGRDREAAELAIAHVCPIDDASFPTQGGPMEALDQLDQLGPLLTRLVSGIRADQLEKQTPCINFTVRGVLEHMIGGATLFAAAYSGKQSSQPDLGDVLAGFGPALTQLAEAMHSPGALDRTIASPFGEVEGATFARYVVFDGLVHGWDLATATGQDYTPPDELIAEAEAYAQQTIEHLRDGDTFASPIEPPPSATPIQRLVAYTGRKP